jgi:hypothetical protein
MSEITEISSAYMQMIQSQIQGQVETSMLKKALDTEKAVANMLLNCIKQVQEPDESAEGHVNLYV